ncbi:MAG: hypothetical protein H7330_09750 [Hymenobacteraceae bacterium]|nr:hypothetical protein [Hymenobacteraceae bacterium]
MNLLSLFRLLLTGTVVLGAGSVSAQIINPVPTAPTDSARLHEATESRSSDDKEFANPSVLGMGPSKGLIVRYERAPDFSIASDGQQTGIGDSTGQIAKLNVFTIKAYGPLWNHPHLKVVLGLNYEKSQYNFENRAEAAHYPLYNVIDDRNLRTIGTQLVVLRPIDGRRYFLLRGKGELNGDYKSSNRRLALNKYLKYSAEGFYGWKRSPRESIALGFQYGYTFGRISIYPAVIYNRSWSDHWGFEGLLPAKARVRYNINEKTLLYGGYEVQGNSYTVNLNLGPAYGDAPHELRRTDIAGKLRAERELLPFLWVAAEAGYRYYVSFNVFDRPGISSRAKDNKLIDSTLGNSAFVGFEMFLTPPRKRILKQ